MVDGRFYDAGAYKADPVPMALEQGTVYEAERAGNSLGLFTVNQVFEQKNNWIAEGTYHANGEKIVSTRHKAETKPREEKEEGPPVLRRPGSAPATPASPSPEAKPESPPQRADNSAAKATPAPQPEPAPEDPNIPKLRRGAPARGAEAGETSGVTPAVKSSAARSVTDAGGKSPGNGPATEAAVVEMLPAVSDAGGPEPRPYGYDMKPEEEEIMRTKLLAMATDELRKQAKEFGKPEKPALAPRRKAGAKTATLAPPPSFEDVQLRVFDVSSSNEPVAVLSARAHPAQNSKTSKLNDFYVTLVARSDIYGELRKLLSVVTDSEHLDVNPRMQLVDVVDADGDGRGELLFRQISDAGTAYVIYRVTPDRLWPLYESSPQ
jgi:hypothetical protein